MAHDNSQISAPRMDHPPILDSRNHSPPSDVQRGKQSLFGLTQIFQWIAYFCAFVASALGILTLMSWAYGWPRLRSPLSGYTWMQKHTALCCLLLGAALFLATRPRDWLRGWASPLLRGFCSLTLMIITLAIADYLFNWNQPLLVTSQMSYQTALGFGFIAISLLLLDWEPKLGHRPAQYISMLTMMFPLQAFLTLVNRSIYGQEVFGGGRQMSMTSAFALFALAIGTLAARPSEGSMKIVASDTLAGQIIRRLFFPLILSVPVLSLFIGLGAGVLVEPASASSTFIMIIITLFATLTWVTTETVHASERKLRENEERLRMALTASEIGFYDWDIKRNLIIMDPHMSEDWGLVEQPKSLEDALAVIHPDDKPLVEKSINESISTGRGYMLEYRVIRPCDGRIVCVEIRGEVHRDESGQPFRFLGTCLNITERKKAEQQLQESESRFRQFAEAMPQMAFVADDQGQILYFNQRHYEYFGLDAADVHSLEWEKQKLHHPDDEQRTLELWSESVRTGKLYQIEYRLRRHDGEYRWHLGRAVPVRNSAGAVVQWLGTNTDIHEQKLANQKLLENEAKFRIMTDAMPQMVWSAQPDGYHDYYNKRWYEFTGASEGSTDGMLWNRLLHQDDQRKAQEVWQQSLSSGEPYEIAYRLRHRSGQYRWTLVRALPLRDEAGEVIRWMGTCTDIHDQKQASEILAASEARLRAILSQLPVGVVIADATGKVVTINDSLRQIWGTQSSSLDSFDRYEAYSLESGKRLKADDWALARALKNGDAILNDVVRLKGRHGEEKIILNSAAPVHTESGELTGVIAVVQDITEQKRFERELALARDEAERANLAKSQFLANMSHEIRSPMNSVIGYADLLTDADLNDEDRMMYASRIKASGSHLLHIIDDILDLSKVESGHVQIEWRRFSITELIAECIQSMSVLAHRKKIELVAVCDTPVPQTIESDSIRFRQILMNVIGNAIKFTEKGQVRVGLRFKAPGCFIVDVEDSGIGIAPDQQKDLFQPFMQSDASITRKFGGTGLGLHLSRRLAQALGGNLDLTWSVPGQGSCFTLRVRTGDVSESPLVTTLGPGPNVPIVRESQEPSLGRKYKVLIVDDNADNQALMKAYLRKADVHWETANDGERALAMASRNSYDIILMDVMMPVMDGLEATRRLRAAGYNRPIIALTAHAMKEEVEKSFAAGCDGHLSKPVDIKELLATMKRFVDLSARSEQQMFH